MREGQLNAAQRKALEELLPGGLRTPGMCAGRIILLSADGVARREIAERVGISPQHVSRIRARFVRSGVAGLAEQPKAVVKTTRFGEK